MADEKNERLQYTLINMGTLMTLMEFLLHQTLEPDTVYQKWGEFCLVEQDPEPLIETSKEKFIALSIGRAVLTAYFEGVQSQADAQIGDLDQVISRCLDLVERQAKAWPVEGSFLLKAFMDTDETKGGNRETLGQESETNSDDGE